MTLLERLLRQLGEAGFSGIVVRVTSEQEARSNFRPDFHKRYPELPLRFVEEDGESIASLHLLLLESDGDVVLLDANALYDERLTSTFANLDRPTLVQDKKGAYPTLVRFNRAQLSDNAFSPYMTKQLLIKEISQRARKMDISELPSYYRRLRAYLPVYWLLVNGPSELPKADRLLKGSVHKSTNDVIAKFIHPPLEFALTRLICNSRIQPNQVTWFNVVLAFSAIPFFYTGHFAIALAMALTKGVTDGVDGKLARLTIRTTNFGDKLDHITDTLYLNGYYIAMALYFGNGQLDSFPVLALGWVIPTYFLDRLVRWLFIRRHHETVQDYRKIDTYFRLVQSNRNISMWSLLIACLAGHPLWGFYAIVFWTPSNFIYYGLRYLWEFNRTKTWIGYEQPPLAV